METISKNTKRITIRGNWNIGMIEKYIKEFLDVCEIWGELNISIDEYNHIKTRISGELGSCPTATEVKALIKMYPVVMVTDIVSFVLYEFDKNDFWNGWASRYNINIIGNQQTDIGRMVRDIFVKFGFKIEDDGYAYVTPILCQAGIPWTCFDKLFDILDSTLNSPYFIVREIVSELMGYRSYLIDSPVKRYFRLHTEKAIDLLAQLREMMHSMGDLSGKGIDIPEIPGVEQRIVRRYVQWSAEAKKIGRKSRRNTQYYFSPKLVFDDAKGVCLFIPEQTLRQDSIYKLHWTIICDGDIKKTKTFTSQVMNTNGRNYTIAVNIPVDFAVKYTIELRDDDDQSALLTIPWIVEVFDDENDVLTFKEDGSLMSSNQRYLSQKGTVIIYNDRLVNVTESCNINILDIDLPKSWAGLKASWVYISDKAASLKIKLARDVIYIEPKHYLDIDLGRGNTLFDENYNNQEIPVYISFPTIEVSGDLESYNKELFNNWQVVVNHWQSNTKHTVMLSELDYKVYENIYFNLDTYARQHFAGMYGTYDLRVYDGKTKKYFTFYLSPEIQYAAHIEDIKSDRSFGTNNASFYIKKNAVIELEFGKDITVLPASFKGVDWEEVSTKNKSAYINGNVVFKNNDSLHKIPFKKTIRKFEWSFWDENTNDLSETGRTKQFYMKDLEETRWRIVLHFTDVKEKYDSVRLVLEMANKNQIQSKDIVIDSFGNASVTLNLFVDTIRQYLLPQRLRLYLSKGYDEYEPICIAIIKSYVELKKPKYRIYQNSPIIYWEKSFDNELLNKELELIALHDPKMESIKYPLTEILNVKNKDGKNFEYIQLERPLNNGIYFIDAKESMEFSFFSDSDQAVPIFNKDYVLCVNGEQVLKELLAATSPTLAEWLAAATVALNKFDQITLLATKLKESIRQGQIDFDVKECAPLLFSLLVNSGEKPNLAPEIKLKAREIVDHINSYLITNTERVEILKLLLESNISDVDCKLIISELQLYLFCPNGSVLFDKSNLQRMWDINEKLAILMNLRGCVSDISVDLERVLTRIGCEVLQEIIRITPSANCNSNDWLTCMELIIDNKCQCSHFVFECSKKVWGDGDEYSKLFVEVKKGRGSPEIVRQTPNENHTNGYELFNKNYLTLIFELIPDPPNDNFRKSGELANKEGLKLEKLIQKYAQNFGEFLFVLQKRRLSQNVKLDIFYLIGCASALIALSTTKTVALADIQEILPFWKITMSVYPELIYRDLILAELYILFENRKGRLICL